MAKNNEAKVKFLAETQEFRENVKQAASSITELNSELRLNAEQMKTNGTSAEALADRQKLLQEQLEQARTKTQNLAAQMESCTRNYGENSAEAQKLATQINNAKIAEEKIQQEINRVNQELSEQASEAGNTGNALEKLENTISSQESELADLRNEYAATALEFGTNSKQAKTLARQITDLSGELNENRDKMARVERAADNLEGEVEQAGEAARDASDGFTVWKGTLSDLASSAIQGVISGVSELASAFWNLGDETRELRTNMGKVVTAFESAGHSAETASDTYNDFYAIVADEGQATEAVSHLAKLTDSQKELDQWTTICTGVYATFGDSLPIENLTEAANETAKTGALTGGLADALNWAGVNEEAFQEKLDACNSEAEREALIRETLIGLYDDAAASYQETNGQIMDANRAQAEYNTQLAGLGEVIEPIKTVFMEGMAGMLKSVKELIAGVDMEAIKASIQGAFDYLQTTVFPAIKTAIQWFIDNKDIIIAGLAGILAGILAFKVVTIIQGIVSAFKAWQAATTGLTLAQKLLNLVMMANPIALVVAAIAALVAAFVLLWNNCEGFRNFWINLWETIKHAASVAWEAICSFFVAAWEAIKVAWSGVCAWFSNIWQGICKAFSNCGAWFKKLFSDAWKGIQNAWASVKTWFSNIWQGICNAFSNCGTWFKNIFSTAWNNVKNAWSACKSWFSNLWSGVKNVFSSVGSWFRNIFSNAWQAVKNVFANWGSFFGGLWDTIKNKFSAIGTNIANAISGAVKSGINGVISSIERIINGGINLINGAIGLINKIPGVNIGKLSKLSLPRLAGGGVLYGETAFIGGEYSGARTNPEIVTPQNIMRETFEDALNAHFENSFNLDRLAASIEALASRPVVVAVNDREIIRATASANDSLGGIRSAFKSRGLVVD